MSRVCSGLCCVTAVVIDEQVVGLYTNSIVMSDNASRYVTWCTEPQEKTIRLWGVVDGLLDTIGAFTPDEEVVNRKLCCRKVCVMLEKATFHEHVGFCRVV